MKPGDSAYHLIGKGLTPPEQVTKAELHLPALEELPGLCQLLQMSVPQGLEASPSHHVSAHLSLPTEALGWSRGGTKDSNRTGSGGQREDAALCSD